MLPARQDADKLHAATAALMPLQQDRAGFAPLEQILSNEACNEQADGVMAWTVPGAATISGLAMAQQSGMSLFVASTGSGKGADLGGLAGADQSCQKLAAAAGAGYLYCFAIN